MGAAVGTVVGALVGHGLERPRKKSTAPAPPPPKPAVRRDYTTGAVLVRRPYFTEGVEWALIPRESYRRYTGSFTGGGESRYRWGRELRNTVLKNWIPR